MKFNIIALLAAVLILSGCSKKEVYHQLTIDIQHKFNGQNAEFNNLSLQNDAGNILSFFTFKYLISGIELENSKGERLQLEDKYAFIDAVNGQTSFVLDSIPEGEYTSIHFMIGLDETANKSNPNLYGSDHPLNPTVNNMHWDWSSGYIFLSLEGQYKSDANSTSSGAYSYHIAFEENQMPFDFQNLDLPFESNKTINLEFDLATIFNSPNLINITDGNVSHSSSDNGLANNISNNVKNSIKFNGHE